MDGAWPGTPPSHDAPWEAEEALWNFFFAGEGSTRWRQSLCHPCLIIRSDIALQCVLVAPQHSLVQGMNKRSKSNKTQGIRGHGAGKKVDAIDVDKWEMEPLLLGVVRFALPDRFHSRGCMCRGAAGCEYWSCVQSDLLWSWGGKKGTSDRRNESRRASCDYSQYIYLTYTASDLLV